MAMGHRSVLYRVGLVAIAAWLTTQPLTGASAAASAKKLALTGTVTAISLVHARPPSQRNWAVTVRVESVKAGKFSVASWSQGRMFGGSRQLKGLNV